MPPIQSPIHILGIGNLGKLLANNLRVQHPKIPITLLFHRRSLAEEWEEAGRLIGITRNGLLRRVGGFDVEFVDDAQGEGIENLVVATKTYKTVEALKGLGKRLDQRSTLLFTQNGIGTIDEVNKHVFSDPSSRPTYLSGIFNHGVYATSTFHSVHAGLANAFIGPSFPDLEALLSSKATPVANNTSTDSETPPSAHPSPSVPPPSTTTPSLVQAILACPELAAIHVTAEQLLHIQLQKLAVNAVINPLSAIFACRNGALFENPRIQPLMDILIAEISAILTGIVSTLALSNFGPSNRPSEQDLREWEKARETFGYPALRKQVWDVGEMVKENVSSMRQDVLAGRQTEIEYINGFLVRAGRALGAPCGVNGRIVEMVREGVTGVKDEEIYERFGLKG